MFVLDKGNKLEVTDEDKLDLDDEDGEANVNSADALKLVEGGVTVNVENDLNLDRGDKLEVSEEDELTLDEGGEDNINETVCLGLENGDKLVEEEGVEVELAKNDRFVVVKSELPLVDNDKPEFNDLVALGTE